LTSAGTRVLFVVGAGLFLLRFLQNLRLSTFLVQVEGSSSGTLHVAAAEAVGLEHNLLRTRPDLRLRIRD
jgi:hypothetical protein